MPTNNWNKASTDGINATNRITTLEGRTSVWNQASIDAINATGRLTIVESQTNNWNTSYNWVNSNSNKLTTVIRFKADIGSVNISYSSGSANLIPFTNVVLAASGGSIYSNAAGVCQWWPKATNGIVKLTGGIDTAENNNGPLLVNIYKNNANISKVLDISSSKQNLGGTWHFIDTATPTINDYYQIYYTIQATANSVGTNGSNWIFGEVIP